MLRDVEVQKGSLSSEPPTSPPALITILFFIATTTAVMCSQALPAIGSTIMPRNAWPSPVFSLTSSMEPVSSLLAARNS